jgi:hypothetical protein
LLITHQVKEIWRNEKPTGLYDWDGYNALDYYTNVIIEQEHDDTHSAFYVSIRLCQEQPELLGDAGARILMDDQITFPTLAALVNPNLELPE